MPRRLHAPFGVPPPSGFADLVPQVRPDCSVALKLLPHVQVIRHVAARHLGHVDQEASQIHERIPEIDVDVGEVREVQGQRDRDDDLHARRRELAKAVEPVPEQSGTSVCASISSTSR